MPISRVCWLIAVSALLSACAGFSPEWSSTDVPPPKAPVARARVMTPPTINVDKESVEDLKAPYSDLWNRIRDGFALDDLDSPLVIKHVRWYADRPDYVDRMMSRSSRFLFYIVEEVERRKMPMEFALLPFTESAFNPAAYSRAKASGMWQFMPATGKDYKLTQNIFRDERRDVIQSTEAALDYLQRLYKMFGDWNLVLAAYNWGEGNVTKAIKKNQAQGLPTDYLSLRMPDETRNYVPKLMAVKRLVMDPKAYGLTLPELENHPYFVVVTTEKDIDVDLVAKFARMSVDEFKSLNPSFNKPVILGASEPQILLPFGRAESFQENLRSFTGKLSSWTAIRLGNRETVDQLAKRLNVDASHIRDINNIPKGMAIKAGSTVIIPKSHRGKDVPDYLAENATISLEREVANKKKSAKAAAKGKKAQNSSGSTRSTKAKSTKKPAKKETGKKEASKKDSAKHSG